MMIKNMRVLLSLFAASLFVLSQVHAAVITGQEPITVNLGAGSNVSYLVFNESTLSTAPIRYAWHYDGLINPQTGTNWSGEDLFQESSRHPWERIMPSVSGRVPTGSSRISRSAGTSR